MSKRSSSCPPLGERSELLTLDAILSGITREAFDDEFISYKTLNNNQKIKDPYYQTMTTWQKRNAPLGRKRTRRVTIDIGDILHPMDWRHQDGKDIVSFKI
jgi:hypothetical protein